MTRKQPYAIARPLTLKFETQLRYAGELSSLLRPIRDAEPLYSQLQAKERTLRQEKEALDARFSFIASLGAKLDDSERRLASLSDAAVAICELNGPSQVRAHLELDGADVASTADHVAEAVWHVPGVGPGLAKWLRELKATYVKVEARRNEAVDAFHDEARAFAASLLKGSAMITEARAFLISMGIRFPIRLPRPRAQVLRVLPSATPPFPARPSLPAAS